MAQNIMKRDVAEVVRMVLGDYRLRANWEGVARARATRMGLRGVNLTRYLGEVEEGVRKGSLYMIAGLWGARIR